MFVAVDKSLHPYSSHIKFGCGFTEYCFMQSLLYSSKFQV